MKLVDIYLLFWFSSILGWIMEEIVCSIGERKIINRGFLIGPYCPIYGVGAVLILLLKGITNYYLIFILSLLLCSAIEYLVSFIMELVFKVRWWDYSDEPFNINGRICLKNAIAFGILGVLLIGYILPLFNKVINSFSNKTLIAVIILVITTIDIILSFIIMFNIKKTLKIQAKDATNDLKLKVKNILLEKNFLYKRLVKAYTQVKLSSSLIVKNTTKTVGNNIEKLKEISELIKEKTRLNKLINMKKYNLMVFLLSGILLGGLIGIVLKQLINYPLILGIGVGIFSYIIFDHIRKKYDSKQ